MKKILLIILLTLSCTIKCNFINAQSLANSTDSVPSWLYLDLNEKVMVAKYDSLYNFYLKASKKPALWKNYKAYCIQIINSNPNVNSIPTLQSMSNSIKIYKFDKIKKYYRLCIKSPKNWKFFKGWSIRTFESK